MVLDELNRSGVLSYSASARGVRDDPYILDAAFYEGGVVVSNDSFKDSHSRLWVWPNRIVPTLNRRYVPWSISWSHNIVAPYAFIKGPRQLWDRFIPDREKWWKVVTPLASSSSSASSST